MVTGWAIDQQTGGNVGDIYLDIDGLLYRAYYGVSRADLVKRFQRTEYENSGFHAAIPISELGTGQHSISIKILSSDRKGYYSSGGEVTFTTTTQ